VDSIRAVEISVRATSGEVNRYEQQETVRRLVQLPNVGVSRLVTCGAKPALGVALAADGAIVGGVPAVTLTWSPAVDERGGERDVLRYVIWRKTNPADPWGDPYTSLAVNGAPTYRFDDTGVDASTNYLYALAAQDCTPSLSGMTTANANSPAAP
jgi:hypothetical protein